jgi:hypothetical protein
MFRSIANNTTDLTIGTETHNPSETPEYTAVFNGIRVGQSLDFCSVDHRLFFFSLAIALSLLPQLTSSDLWYLQTLLSLLLLLSISTHSHLIDDYVPCMRGVKHIV